MIEVKEHPVMDEYLEKERIKKKMSSFDEIEIATRVSAMSKDELVLAIKYFPTEVIQNELSRRLKKQKTLDEKVKELYELYKEV